MTTDTLTNSLGKPGKFQVLLYLYLSANFIHICWNYLGMAFLGAKTKHHCTVANSTDVSRLVPLIWKNGKSEWDGCHLFDGYNTSEKIPCPNGWTYDLPAGETTIISEGLQMVTFTSLVEIFASQYRTFTGLGVGFPWAVGIMTFSLFSYLIKDWRYIQLMSTSVCLFQIGLVCCLPESIRWLLINNRFDQAENVVRNISTFNKISFPKDIFDKTVNEIEKTEANKSSIKSYTIADIFRSSVLRKRSLIMMVIWFSTSLGYYGLSLNISSFAGNKYLNFFISGALEPIIITSTIVILNRFGRRRPVCVIFLVAGSALIIAGVLPKSNKSVQTLVTVLAIAGRMFVSGNFGNIYIYTCELYPTVIRNVGFGSGIFWARIGGIAAPQILLLGEYTAEAVPVIIFGGMLLLSGTLDLLLPETLNVKLPETLQDVRKFEMPQEGQGKSGLNVAEDKNIELVS